MFSVLLERGISWVVSACGRERFQSGLWLRGLTVLKSLLFKAIFFSSSSNFKCPAKSCSVVWRESEPDRFVLAVSTKRAVNEISTQWLPLHTSVTAALPLPHSPSSPLPGLTLVWRPDTNVLRGRWFPFSHSGDAASLAHVDGNTLCSGSVCRGRLNS